MAEAGQSMELNVMGVLAGGDEAPEGCDSKFKQGSPGKEVHCETAAGARTIPSVDACPPILHPRMEP